MTRLLPAKRGLFAFGPGSRRSAASDPVLRFLLIALAVVFVAILAAGTLANEAKVEAMRLKDVQSGQLLLRTDQPGAYRPAPQVQTDIQMDVSGTGARVTVSQRFENPSDDWVEGVYAFPLPENAAVDRLRLQIGERFIEGKIKEREAARKVYEQAKAEGRKASLVEEQRPNLFTNEVTNIGRARPSWSRSNISRRCATTRAPSRCGSRSSSAPVTFRAAASSSRRPAARRRRPTRCPMRSSSAMSCL